MKFKDSKPTLVDANPKEMVAGQITEALVECGPTERDIVFVLFPFIISRINISICKFY